MHCQVFCQLDDNKPALCGWPSKNGPAAPRYTKNWQDTQVRKPVKLMSRGRNSEDVMHQSNLKINNVVHAKKIGNGGNLSHPALSRSAAAEVSLALN